MVCGSPASGSIARRSPTASSASSSRRPATSPLPRLRRTRRTIRVPCRTCCGRARWSSARRRDRWISATGRSGGSSSSAPTGAGRTGRAARSAGSTTIPVVHIAYRDAEAYARWAGQGAADRGRMGVRRARRAGRRRVRLGRRIRARRPPDGEHLAGRVPAREHPPRRLRAHVAGHRLSAERLRYPRHDRQRLGMDHGLVQLAARGRSHRSRAACPRTRAAGARTRATIPASRRSGSRAR